MGKKLSLLSPWTVTFPQLFWSPGIEVPTDLGVSFGIGSRQTPGASPDSINELWWLIDQCVTEQGCPCLSLLLPLQLHSRARSLHMKQWGAGQAPASACLRIDSCSLSLSLSAKLLALLLEGGNPPPLGLQREEEALSRRKPGSCFQMKRKGMPGRQKHTLLTFCGIRHQFLLRYGPNVVLTEEARNRCALSRSPLVGTNLGLILSHKYNAVELPLSSCHFLFFSSISSCDLPKSTA